MLDIALYNEYCFDSKDLLSQDLLGQDLLSQDLLDILIVMAISVFSLICSTLFVSNCVYKKMVNEFVEIYNSNTTLYDYDPYFYKCLDDYDLLEKKELSTDYLNSLNAKYIKETTPFGIVILTYNNEYNSFDYYCKKSPVVSFNYLEVVSRIYVVNFDCKAIYSDNYDNLIMLYNKKNGIINNDDNRDADKDNRDDDDNNNVFFTKKVSYAKKVESYNFVSNKYKYKGTLDDFNNYIKNNNLISIEDSIKDNSEHNREDNREDSSTIFFSLEKNSHVTELDDLNISFKTFKSLDKVKTL